jgi:hypothetical protein
MYYHVIGPAPNDEPCAQVGSADYIPRAEKECSVFIDQLRREYGPEPMGSLLMVMAFPHEFGHYYTVVCQFTPDFPDSVDYAMACEESVSHWDDEAKAALQIKE